MALDPRHNEVRLHLFVDHGEKDDVLRRILEHLLTQRPHRVPESVVQLHLLRDSLLVCVLDLGAEVFLQ